MGKGTIEENSRRMDLVQEEVNLLWGLEQFNLAHMMHNKPDSMLVQCRPLNERGPVFNLEFGLGDQYTAVVGRVADKLQVDPDRIRLASHHCLFNEPCYGDLGDPFDCLRDILERSDKTICDVLLYDVDDDDAPLPRNSKTVEVAAYGGYPNAKQGCIDVQPDHIIVEDLLNDKEVVKLTNSNAKLRLVGFSEDTKCKVFSPKEKIENIPEYFTLRVEEIPKEKELGCGGHHEIHVYNITKTDGVLKFHEEEHVKPFIFVIRDDETLAEVKVRLREKLFENEEFSQWKFGLLQPVGPPVFLEDTDVVSSCFKGKGDLLENPEKLNGGHPFITDADILLCPGNLEGTPSGVMKAPNQAP